MAHTINIVKKLGTFANNKDIALDLRVSEILPRIKTHEIVVLNLSGVEGSIQSLIHALTGEPLQIYGKDAQLSRVQISQPDH